MKRSHDEIGFSIKLGKKDAAGKRDWVVANVHDCRGNVRKGDTIAWCGVAMKGRSMKEVEILKNSLWMKRPLEMIFIGTTTSPKLKKKKKKKRARAGGPSQQIHTMVIPKMVKDAMTKVVHMGGGRSGTRSSVAKDGGLHSKFGDVRFVNGTPPEKKKKP